MKFLALTVGNYTIEPPGGVPTADPGFVGVNLIKLGIELLLFLAVVLCLVFLIWGGITWIMSGGDKHGIETARAKITYAIIGLIVVFISFLIINIIGQLFNVELINTRMQIQTGSPATQGAQ